MPTALYLHIPWCVRRCYYCDFNAYVSGGEALKDRYRAALHREIAESGAALKRPRLTSLYIGGGTPTSLPPDRLAELIAAVRAAFELAPQAEVTVEANPGTLSPAYLRQLRAAGVNRLSLGAQSFRERELRFLHRLHTAADTGRAIEQARTAGFDNLSLDLIYNLPGQSLADWQTGLSEAMAYGPEHLSLYTLLVEPDTLLYRRVEAGHIPRPDEDLAADMYAHAIDALGAAGYRHYEISNWARTGTGTAAWQTPSLASAHNLVYWRNRPYLGVGAGAVSTLKGRRWLNLRDPRRYSRAVETGAGLGLAADQASREQIDRPTAMAEHMLLGLRLLCEGVAAGEFAARFGSDLAGHYSAAIAYGLERGLAEWIDSPAGPRFRLTRQGRFVANQLLCQFC